MASSSMTPGPLSQEVSAILRGHAARVRMRQQDLADAVGLSQTQVGRILRGVRPVDVDTAGRLAAALGVSLVDVLREAEETVSARTDASNPIVVTQGGGESVRIGEPSRPTPQTRSSRG